MGSVRLEEAGGGRGSIPILRDGGIQELLAEAEADHGGRRFDYVICESIDRISRRTYIATEIENRLERAGVRLLAADEPFVLTQAGGRRAKVATQLLTRRVKQGISEFYVVEMLEKSWDGFAVHTEEGFNVGKACYGYRAKLVPHPVPAKRAKGHKKTFLEPDPLQAPVVQKMFQWRVEERLGYQAIADRLNTDLVSNPPPTPVDPGRAVGRWTYSNVRDVLSNPKHTGRMVWNRRARKTGGNAANPVSEWIWSPEPVHEALIDVDTYIQAQQVSGHRFGSRSTAGANTKHPDTKRSYPLRTYLFCELEDPGRWDNPEIAEYIRCHEPPPDAVDRDVLRLGLLEGPDRLSAATAHYCLGAGLRDLLPQQYGWAYCSWHELPAARFDHRASAVGIGDIVREGHADD